MWFLFALGTAFFQGVKDVCIKKSPATSGLALCWAYTWCTAAFLWIAAAIAGIPAPGPDFWPALCASATLNAVAMTLYFTALRQGELSLTAPMLAFTPLFMLLTSPLILGEMPGPMGLAGIVCITAGSYILNMGRTGEGGSGPLAPFRALAASRGPRLMLVVAAIWSVSANFDKIGVAATAPEFWVASLFTTIALMLTPVVLYRERSPVRALRGSLASLAGVSLAEAAAVVLQMYALTLTLVPYVIAVKRLSAVFGVAFGAVFFRERRLGYRIAGALIMVAGVGCICLQR
jgi:drug/metabolite transporter (DMT)-like permease